ncbi:hypothetical protein GNF81_19160, partial [Clostridium perfringens]|nr:hypothetical protein [Clostridium perfringens]
MITYSKIYIVKLLYKRGINVNLMKKTKLRKLSLLVCLTFMFQLIVLSPKTTLAASIGNASTSISYDIKGDPKVGNTIEIAVNTSNVSDLYGASIDFVYDSSLIEVQSINKGSIWGTGTNVKEPVKTIKNGQANLAITFTGNTQGISGNGTI